MKDDHKYKINRQPPSRLGTTDEAGRQRWSLAGHGSAAFSRLVVRQDSREYLACVDLWLDSIGLCTKRVLSGVKVDELGWMVKFGGSKLMLFNVHIYDFRRALKNRIRGN